MIWTDDPFARIYEQWHRMRENHVAIIDEDGRLFYLHDLIEWRSIRAYQEEKDRG